MCVMIWSGTREWAGRELVGGDRSLIFCYAALYTCKLDQYGDAQIQKSGGYQGYHNCMQILDTRR